MNNEAHLLPNICLLPNHAADAVYTRLPAYFQNKSTTSCTTPQKQTTVQYMYPDIYCAEFTSTLQARKKTLLQTLGKS